jgi:hypothetical protein
MASGRRLTTRMSLGCELGGQTSSECLLGSLRRSPVREWLAVKVMIAPDKFAIIGRVARRAVRMYAA